MGIQLKYNVLNNHESIFSLKGQILDLFFRCFNKHLDCPEIWDWAYMDNPNGKPIVSVCFDGSKLIGHYGIIPIYYNNDVNRILCGLSMSNMVDEKYIFTGAYINLAKLAYEKANKLGYTVVYGFPNKNSYPALKKRLGWEFPEEYRVVSTPMKTVDPKYFQRKTALYSFDIRDKAQINWRLSKPNNNYFQNDNLIYKYYRNSIDLIYFEPVSLKNIDPDEICNIIIPKRCPLYNESKSFKYYSGYKIINHNYNNITMNIQLINSDIF
jgi:hypothetical protein